MSKQMLAVAIALAAKVFEDKTDKSGKPYILHCLRVMNGVDQNDEEQMQIAVLHDVVEDTDTTTLLTHNSNTTTYDNYIKAISYNTDATRVKLADLKDNSDITRLKGLRKKDIERTEKYHRAYVFLSN
jgi:(p)ppGpp synthase/HD superfamily hydrolase